MDKISEIIKRSNSQVQITIFFAYLKKIAFKVFEVGLITYQNPTGGRGVAPGLRYRARHGCAPKQ